MDNHDKLILAALGELPRAKTLQEVARDYSRRIRDAVMPVSVVTAPIVVSLLTQYAEEIKKIGPGIAEAAEEFTQLPKETVVVTMPRKREGRT